MSLAVSGSLYAILFCIILILPDAHGSPTRVHAKSLPLALRLTAASEVAQANTETQIENHQHETGSANRNEDTTAASAPPAENSSAASLQEQPGARGSASETAENEAAAISGANSDPRIENGEYGKSGIVSGSGRADFISWFDSAIRRSLTYPERARKRNLEGTVTISVEISADGKNCRAGVAETSGSPTLDRAALRFVASLFPSPVSPEKPFSGTLKIQYILVQNER